MKMILPENVSYIIDELEKAGYEAYAVGGCVRDTILGRTPEDWDITTSAKPYEVKACFKKTIDTGIQHGTVTVMLEHIGYEVTTYRIDGEYEDSRHPKSVEFTNNLRLDLERRDFTINAMAYNDTSGLIDEFGGLKDLKNGIICCVGDAGERFDEDALRMLRAVRFSGQLGFVIEEKTKQAIIERAASLEKISAERIRVELSKLLVSKKAGQLREVCYTGMSRYFLPELDKMMETEQKNSHHIYTVGEHCIHCVEVMNLFFENAIDREKYTSIPPQIFDRIEKFAVDLNKKEQLILCLVMLLHDVAKPDSMTIDSEGVGHFYGHPQKGERMAQKILRRLTFDNETIVLVKRLINYHDYRIEPRSKTLRRAVSKIGKDIMPMLFLVQCADILSQNPVTFQEKFTKLNKVMEVYDTVMASQSPLSIKDLQVDGNDLIKAGINPGPELGGILKKMLDIVLDEPEKNKKEILMGYVERKEL